jgi:hypothetical protein
LERLGYETHLAYRREKDAVVVGFKKSGFKLLDKQVIDYNDMA